MRVNNAHKLKEKMTPGQVFRREQLASYSSAIDRDLKTLVDSGDVKKAGAGLYYRPKLSRFGELPAEDFELVSSFLKDSDFLMVAPNLYNGLRVGLTQVYHTTVVYNRKRHERIMLDGRSFDFRRPKNFPKKLSVEYLLVDLLNNLSSLTEETTKVRLRIKEKIKEVNTNELLRAARDYGKVATRYFFEKLILERNEVIST